MTTENSPLSKKERYILSAILFLITFMIAVDIYSDAKDGAELGHMATELFIGIIALIGNGFIIGQSFKTQKRLERTKESLELSQRARVNPSMN